MPYLSRQRSVEKTVHQIYELCVTGEAGSTAKSHPMSLDGAWDCPALSSSQKMPVWFV